MAEFFGFEINRKGKKEPERVSFVPDTESDGAGVIQSGGHFGQYIDVDGDKAKNEIDLILKYRDVATQPECDAAIEDIVNVPWNGVVITSMNEFSPTGESAPSLDGSK